jgi:hypothetical protein
VVPDGPDDVASTTGGGGGGGGVTGPGVGDGRAVPAARRGVTGLAPSWGIAASALAGVVVAVAAYCPASGGPSGPPIAARPPEIARNAPAAPPIRSRVTPVSGTMRDGTGTGGRRGSNSSVNAPVNLAARCVERSYRTERQAPVHSRRSACHRFNEKSFP